MHYLHSNNFCAFVPFIWCGFRILGSLAHKSVNTSNEFIVKNAVDLLTTPFCLRSKNGFWVLTKSGLCNDRFSWQISMYSSSTINATPYFHSRSWYLTCNARHKVIYFFLQSQSELLTNHQMGFLTEHYSLLILLYSYGSLNI